MSRKQDAKDRINAVLWRYGILDVRRHQPDPERQYLADAINEFMESNPSLKQIKALETQLCKGLIAAAVTASTNVRQMIPVAQESPRCPASPLAKCTP